MGIGQLGSVKIALGLPKGFNQPGWVPGEKHPNNKMYTRCWLKDTYEITERKHWDKFNVPVWALCKDGFLFVRTYSPRINQTYIDIVEEGTLDMVPDAIDVGQFYEEID
jgi:hypothetical protein